MRESTMCTREYLYETIRLTALMQVEGTSDADRVDLTKRLSDLWIAYCELECVDEQWHMRRLEYCLKANNMDLMADIARMYLSKH